MTKNFGFILVISLLTGAIEIDLSVPSFPDIADYFAISDTLTQMTVAVNFLGFCLSSAIYGPLSDAFGRRKIMLIGNGLMLVGAIGCAVANSIEFLLLSRFIQGIGASTSAVVAFAMIADIYSSQKSADLIGSMNSLITVFMSIAPIAGGFINESIGWRGNYIVIAIISCVSWFMLYFCLPETKPQLNKFNLRHILQDFKTLLSDKRFLIASSVPSLYFAGWMIFVSCGSFLYMEAFNLPIMSYVLHQGIIIATFSVTSLFSGKILQLIGEKNCVFFGMFFASLGSLLMIITANLFEQNPYLTSLSMMLYGVGAASNYPVIFAKSLDIFPLIKGTASSAIMAMRALICATSIAIASYFYSGKLLSVAAILLTISALIAILSIKLLNNLKFATKNKI